MQRNLSGYRRPSQPTWGPGGWEQERAFFPIGEDTRKCVENTADSPFRFICSMDNSGVPRGTGTLIGPRTVLTAAHCVMPPDETGEMKEDWVNLLAIPGRNGTASPEAPAGYSKIRAIQTAVGPRKGTATDYAVAILEDPIGMTTGWWTFLPSQAPDDPLGTCILDDDSHAPQRKAEVEIAGYPGECPEDDKCASTVTDPCWIPEAKPGSVPYHTKNSVLGSTGAGLLEYLNDTSRGMSGSPVWIERPARQGGRMMVAVHIRRSKTLGIHGNWGVLIKGMCRHVIRSHSFALPGTTPPLRSTVKIGAKGLTVEELQYRLNIWIVTAPATKQARLKVDGKFGSKTLLAVRAFQRAMSLTVDGIVGPQTWTRLQLPF